MITPVRPAWRRTLLFAGPPTAWLGHLLISYLLVPTACRVGTLPLHLATGLFAVAGLASLLAGIRGTDGDPEQPRAAIVLGGIFVLAIALQGTANAMVSPCG